MADFEKLMSSPTSAFAEGLAFLRGQGMINNTLLRVVADLERLGIDYALIGAVTLNQHGYRRFTENIDLLLTPQGLERFRENLVGLGYHPAFPGATKPFLTTTDNVRVEIVTSGEFPGDGLPKPVVFPEPFLIAQEIDGIQTVTLEKLIELKLASGTSAPDRLKDHQSSLNS